MNSISYEEVHFEEIVVVGIDFDIRTLTVHGAPADPTPVVPLPASVVGLAAGLGALTALRCRRRS